MRSWSFAVGSKHGPRSSKWTISTDGRDVYVTNASLGRRLHASLHESGQWHIKGYRPRDPHCLRILTRSHRQTVPDPIFPVGLYIVVPDLSLRRASDVDRASLPDVWLARPEVKGAIEVAIATWNTDVVPEEWPGQAAGTQLVAAYNAGAGNVVGVLTRALPENHPVLRSVETLLSARVPRLRPIRLDSPERRGVVGTTTVHGALALVEFAID